MQNPQVTSIILVDHTNPINQKVIWAPSFDRGFFQQEPTLKKRAGGAGFCFDWHPYGEDPADPDADLPSSMGCSPTQCALHVQQRRKKAECPP